MNDETKRYSMLYGEYDEALDRKVAEDYAKEQRQEGKEEGLDEGIEIGEVRGERRNAIQTAKRLLKKLPDWTDEGIAGLVADITSDDVAQLRKEMNLI